ncbi:MAG: hypothetical protein U0793_23040 [Gemmataceae bacterium]
MGGRNCVSMRRMMASLLGLVLCLAPAQAQTGDAPRLVFGGEESSEPPRPFAGVVFSPLTPRDPVAPAVYQSMSTARGDAIKDRGVVPAIGVSRDPVSDPGSGIQQAGCSSCGGGLIGGPLGLGGCSACGSGPRPPCSPGQSPDCGYCPGHDGPLERFFGGLYECVCCPDPCYDPKWIALADAAFNVASARPVTETGIRWSRGLNLSDLDRGEFFWARQDGGGRGPRPQGAAKVAAFNARYDDLVYHMQGAAGRIGVLIDVPYRSVDPVFAPTASGFNDIRAGFKSLLFDCELLQVGAQFLTYIPSGAAGKGLGTGHVALEPSLLVDVKLTPTTYLETQLSEWIPIEGDQNYQGAVLHTHTSVNQLLWRHQGADIRLIGTAEFNTWSFQDGAYTDPVLGSFQRGSGATYASAGPGLRLFICDKIDFGFGAFFAVNSPNLARQNYITEFRFRF